MAETHLEFEKPLIELRNKIEELKKLSEGGGLDAGEEIASLTQRLTEMMAKFQQGLTPWQRVRLARHPERPYTMDYIERIFTDFMEFSGDRRFSDDKAVVGGFAFFGKQPVMVIGTQKGRDMKENVYRNFGWPNPEGYRKAMRLAQLADKAGVPVITFIDTPGAFPGVSSEERHISEAIAVNLRDMFALKVPVISVIIGEGGSGGALGIGICNKLLMMENAYYSVITPEGCAAILWKDRAYAPQAAECLQLTADRLLELGVADGVIPEPPGGAHHNFDAAAESLRDALKKSLDELQKLSGKELMDQRYAKFRAMGKFEVVDPVSTNPPESSAAVENERIISGEA